MKKDNDSSLTANLSASAASLDTNEPATKLASHQAATESASNPEPAPIVSSEACPKTPQRHSHRILAAICMIIGVAALITAGIFVDRALLNNRNSLNPENPGSDSNLGDSDNRLPSKDPSDLPAEPITIPANDDLTLAFLKLHNEQQNSCYSPLSIRYALEMLREGANGETKTQLDALLGSHQAPHYDNIPEHLALANSLWIKNGLDGQFSQPYIDRVKLKFGADLKFDDFTSAANLNAWIKDNTLGMLDQALSDKDVRGLQASLLNVLALNMNWEHEFMPENTTGKYFNFDYAKNEDNPLYTTMADFGSPRSSDSTSYYYNLAAEATVFASDLKVYNGTELQFVAFMPDDLHQFIKDVNLTKLNNLLSGLGPALPTNDTYEFSFSIYIPKFKINGGLDNLVSDLQELGITDVFDETKADLSKMTNIDNFFISSAVHKTTFDFNEEGIKATAITEIGGFGSGGGPAPIPSSVDIVISIHKPFLYIVRDKASGEVWFIGTVYQPNLWDDDKSIYGQQ